MRILSSILIISAFLLSSVIYAKSTVPMPPKQKPVDELKRTHLSSEIPQDMSKYTYKVRNVIGGVRVGTGDVAVYSFQGGYRVRIGTIPDESEIKIEGFRKGGTQHYFAIEFKSKILTGSAKGKITKYGWIPGTHIYLAGFSSGAK